MKTSTFLRASLLAAALGAALSAQAVTIFTVSSGTYTLAGTTQTQNETVSLKTGGYGPLASLVLNYDTFTMSGTGTYTGTGGTFNFDYSLPTPPVTVGQGTSLTGVWSTGAFNTSTGTYANTTGVGTFSVTLNTTTKESGTVFTGNLEAVPEPASMAALGLGAAALLRRRRKA